jgi:hypothetical protein
MTLRHLEGGQGCANATIFSRLYAVTAGSIGATAVDAWGRTVFNSTNLVLTTFALRGSVTNTWVAGFRTNMVSGTLDASPTARPGIMFKDGVGEQIRIEAVDVSETKPGGGRFRLRVMRGATELARTVETFNQTNSINNWTYFEWKVTINTTTNGSFSLKWHTRKSRNNTATWDAANTGINTANQGTAGADRAVLSWDTGGSDQISITDIYLLDSAGSVNNDFLGELFIEGLKPDGTGSTNQWALAGGATTVEDAIDEGQTVQSVAEDDKGCTSDVVGQITLATMGNLSLITQTTIVGVQVRMYGRMDTGGVRDVEFFYRKTTGSPAQVGSGVLLALNSSSMEGMQDTLENDPNTGVPWVIADINAMQLGFKLSA